MAGALRSIARRLSVDPGPLPDPIGAEWVVESAMSPVVAAAAAMCEEDEEDEDIDAALQRMVNAGGMEVQF